MRVQTIVGDIANQPDAEAVVLSANKNMRGGSGTAGALHFAAGPELENFCAQFAPLEYGRAVISPGFRLPNAWVIHATASPHDVEGCETHLENALNAVMEIAVEKELRTLAVPALGIGKVFRIPINTAIDITSAVLKRHAQAPSSLEWVRLCLTTKLVAHRYALAIAEWQNP